MKLSYEEYKRRQEEKRQRLLARAARKAAEADAQWSRLRGVAARIPPGQPILVGHHSEKRHRRDIKRMDDAMRRSVEARKQAADLESRAASIGEGGISSDDPSADAQLRAKIQRLSAARDRMKEANRRARREKREKPHAGWELSNLGAEIRRCEKRLQELSTIATLAEQSGGVGGISGTHPCGMAWELVEDYDDNRIRIRFDGKPPDDLRKELRSNGFVWSPTAGAWQRKITTNALARTRYMISAWSGTNIISDDHNQEK